MELLPVFLASVISGAISSFIIIAMYKWGIFEWLKENEYRPFFRYALPACDFCLSFRFVIIIAILFNFYVINLNSVSIILVIVSGTTISRKFL